MKSIQCNEYTKLAHTINCKNLTSQICDLFTKIWFKTCRLCMLLGFWWDLPGFVRITGAWNRYVSFLVTTQILPKLSIPTKLEAQIIGSLVLSVCCKDSSEILQATRTPLMYQFDFCHFSAEPEIGHNGALSHKFWQWAWYHYFPGFT